MPKQLPWAHRLLARQFEGDADDDDDDNDDNGYEHSDGPDDDDSDDDQIFMVDKLFRSRWFEVPMLALNHWFVIG